MKDGVRQKTERQTEREQAVRSMLKSLLFPLILLAVIAGGILLILNYRAVPEEEEPIRIYGFEGDKAPIVMENDRLLFTMDPTDTQFTLEVKSSGKVWNSNPEGVAADTLALSEEKNRLESTLLMSYSIVSGLEVAFNTDAYSVKNGIYEIEQGNDYVRVNYSLGDVEREYVIPPVMTAEKYEKWSSAMAEKGVKLLGQYYKKYDRNKLGKKDNEEELLAQYPILETEVIYVLRDTTKGNVRVAMEEYFEEAGYTYEDFEADKELDLSVKESDKPIFNVSVIYRLEDGDLVVEIPFDSMEYKEEYPMYTVTPLPYFGAGGKADEGYLLVPEGGGAIINFNNGKISQSSYYTNVYGWDMCLGRDAVVHNTRATCGVFGISSGDDSFICILEDGSPYAAVRADIGGRSSSYNYVNAVYSVSQREKYDVGDIANSDIYQYIEKLPDESLVQRYRFVDSGDYTDMAKCYGGYLQEKYGAAMDMTGEERTPVMVEIVGAVDKVKQIAGVPVSRPLVLTTFDEAGGIIRDLNEAGVGDLSVRLAGWCNGGVKQKMLNSVKPLSKMGGKKGLKQLAQTAEELDVDLYLNGITQYAVDSGLTNGFFSFRDAAKRISKERAKLLEYSTVTYSERDDLDPYYLLHTDLAMKMGDRLANTAFSLGTGVSFEDTGMDLSSDFDRKKTYSREAVRRLQEEQLKEISEGGTKVCVNMGNDYAVPYCSMVANMDLRGSEYTILDECVPFWQLAVHGRVNYTGRPLNICGNTGEELLYSAEYGAGLCFTFMKESAFALQKTLYTEYYAADYDAWNGEMKEICARYDEELGHTFNQEMTGHKNLTPVLSRTEYADGTKVYVNYGFSDAQADGITVPARDYLVVR